MAGGEEESGLESRTLPTQPRALHSISPPRVAPSFPHPSDHGVGESLVAVGEIEDSFLTNAHHF